jgi:hypothetical protein
MLHVYVQISDVIVCKVLESKLNKARKEGVVVIMEGTNAEVNGIRAIKDIYQNGDVIETDRTKIGGSMPKSMQSGHYK